MRGRDLWSVGVGVGGGEGVCVGGVGVGRGSGRTCGMFWMHTHVCDVRAVCGCICSLPVRLPVQLSYLYS